MEKRVQVAFAATALVGEFPKAWAVAEYSIYEIAGAPPTVMMIVAVRLRDLFTFNEPNRNSAWRDRATDAHGCMVRVVSLGDKVTCLREATAHIMRLDPRPPCNFYGANAFAFAKQLTCNNGQTYENQTDAARSLGLAQGAISRHLKGDLRHVKGYTFAYKD